MVLCNLYIDLINNMLLIPSMTQEALRYEYGVQLFCPLKFLQEKILSSLLCIISCSFQKSGSKNDFSFSLNMYHHSPSSTDYSTKTIFKPVHVFLFSPILIKILS